MSEDIKEGVPVVTDLVARIGLILHGHDPEIQSAALADLTAMWLAGHQDLTEPESAEVLALREELFATWCETVRQLVAPNAAMIRARWGGRRQ